MARVDEHGRAYRKSQLQLQLYVNRRQTALTEATLTALPTLGALDPIIEWVSPLEAELFEEFYDRAFLRAIGRLDLADDLALFWPRSGPRWDALAVARSSSGENLGPVLVEAKSWAGEMRSKMTASPVSAKLISARLRETRGWLGVSEDSASAWETSLYQYGNRLAHLRWFLDVLDGEQAWLLNLCVVDDPDAPTDRRTWETALEAAENELGLTGVEVPNAGRAFLPGGTRDELLAPPA